MNFIKYSTLSTTLKKLFSISLQVCAKSQQQLLISSYLAFATAHLTGALRSPVDFFSSVFTIHSKFHSLKAVQYQ